MKIKVTQGVKFEGIWYQSGVQEVSKDVAQRMVEQGLAVEVKTKAK